MFRALLFCLTVFPTISLAAPTNVTILHFNDLHAHLTPHKDIIRNDDGTTSIVTRGGVAKLATLIKQTRSSNPNTILTNVGDTFHGGVEATFSNGNDIVPIVNALGIDVGVPGNWDFAYGPQSTRDRFAPSSTKQRRSSSSTSSSITPVTYLNLAANLTQTMPKQNQGKLLLPATFIKTFGSYKIGFIGLTSDIVPFMHAKLDMTFDFVQGKDNYVALVKKYSAELKSQGAIVVIVLSELGIHKDIELSKNVTTNEVDAFLSAHTHEVVKHPIISPTGVMVMEAGNDTWLGKLDIVLNGGTKTLTWTLIPIDATVADDPTIASMVATVRKKYTGDNVNVSVTNPFGTYTLTQSIEKVIGTSNKVLNRRNVYESSWNDVTAKLLETEFGVDAVLVPGFRFDAVIPNAGYLMEDNTVATGNVTVEDIYRFIPITFPIATATIPKLTFSTLLENKLAGVFSTTIFNQRGGWMDGLAGVNMTIDSLGADGSKILSLTNEQGQPLPDLLTVLMCYRPMEGSTTLCGVDGVSNINVLTNSSGGQLIFSDYLIQNFGLINNTVTSTNIIDIADRSVFPNSEFVQPIE